MSRSLLWKLGAGVCVGCLILAASGFAQTGVSGSFSGTVTDSSGASIPRVIVKLTNTATGVSQEATTDSTGVYQFLNVSPATYNITVSFEGFASVTKSGLVLLVNQPAKVDFVLQPGSVTQQVNVVAQTPLLNTTNSTIGTVVDGKQVVDLPLNGRQFTQLILLAPGVAPRPNTYQIRFNVQSDWGMISPAVNGGRNDDNNFTIDGVENNEFMWSGVALSPPPDAIQEFKVQSFINSGGFGRSPGANINVVTKSGGNRIHGSVWEFVRNDAVDARNFFNPNRSKFNQNQFGFALGAPIIKDKLWTFGYYEGFRKILGSTALATVPTAAELTGDLSALSVQIYNPFTTRVVGTDISGNPIFARDPFPNNHIPTPMLNSADSALAARAYPAPNITSAAPGAANYIDTQPVISNYDSFSERIDTVLPKDTRFFARVSRIKGFRGTPEFITVPIDTTTTTNLQAVVGLTKSLNTTTVVDFHAQYLRANYGTFRQPMPASFLASSGLLTDFPAQKGVLPADPTMSISDVTGLPGVDENPNVDNSWEYNGSVSKIAGKHTINAGGELYREDYLTNYGYADASFDSLPTSDPQNLAQTGSGLGSFLLGLPSSAYREAGDGAMNIYTDIYSLWFTDQIKLTPKLSLTLALRYDYAPAPQDTRGRLASVNWAESTPGHVVYEVDQTALKYPSGILTPDHTLQSNVGFWNVVTAPPGLTKFSKDNLAPRVGISYQMPHDLVLRTGYAIFYNFNQPVITSATGVEGDWPFGYPFYTPSGLNTPTAANPTPTGIVGTGNLFPPVTFSYSPPTGTPFASQSHSSYPYVQQWNLGIQKELTHDWSLEVSYLGTKGTHLQARSTVNTATPGPGDPSLRRRIPDVGALNINPEWYNSIYNAAMVKLEHRGHGLTTLISYAYSHSIDDVSCSFADCGKTQDWLNWEGSRGNSDFDIAHNLVASWVWQLPIGRGQKYLGSGRGILNGLVGGWQASGIMMLQTGMPVNVRIGYDNANVGNAQQRPSVTSLGDLLPSGFKQSPNHWFNTTALFITPYTFGNLGRNVLRSDGRQNLDFGLAKMWPIPAGWLRGHEDSNVEFRLETFNTMNHAQFGDMINTFGAAGFGTVRTLANNSSPRDIQLALKVNF